MVQINVGDLIIWHTEDKTQGTSKGAIAIVSDIVLSYGGTWLARLKFLKGGDKLVTNGEALIAIENIKNSIESGNVTKYEKRG